MYIIGLNIFHNDTSVALIKDGKILFASTEERFNRVKHTSKLPINAINYVIKKFDLKENQIEFFTVNSKSKHYLQKMNFVIKNFPNMNLFSEYFSRSKKKKKELDKLNNIISFYSKNGIYKVDHHLSHMNSSFLVSDFEECVNISIDGFGDFKSSCYGLSKKNKTEIDGSIFFPHSLGVFYQALTQFVGFKNYGDEYKFMGLSAYGSNSYVNKIRKLFIPQKIGYKLNLNYFTHHKKNIQKFNENGEIYYEDLYNLNLEELLNFKSINKFNYSQNIADIAKSAQTVYEEILFDYLNNIYNKYQNTNLCLSGGCALNSLANGKIKNNTKFKNLFIPYEPADAGGSIGSALTCYYEIENKQTKTKQLDPYLGTNYSNEEIENLLNKKNDKLNYKFKFFEKFDEITNIISDDLILGKIIAWYQDKMEFGPRALGNRSILMDPTIKNAKEILNNKIKLREEFRPFAPSILLEEVSEWFDLNEQSPYMTSVHMIKKHKMKIIPAVCHVDGTGRVQTVDKKLNLKYYDLIQSFFKKTKIPILLNTSFNENEPIVSNPEEALNTFLRTKMDKLVLNNFIVEKTY